MLHFLTRNKLLHRKKFQVKRNLNIKGESFKRKISYLYGIIDVEKEELKDLIDNIGGKL
jgi:hypothetical protein